MLGLGSVTAMDDDGVTQKLQYRTPLKFAEYASHV